MATISNDNVFVNIKELPQVGGIQGGDLLIVETEDGTNIIDFDDIIIDTYQTTFFNVLTANDLAISTELNTVSDDLDALEVTVGVLGGTAFNSLSAQINSNTASITATNTQVSILSSNIASLSGSITTLTAQSLSGGIKAFGYIQLAATSSTNPVTFSPLPGTGNPLLYNVSKFVYDRYRTTIPINGTNTAVSPYLRVWNIYFTPGLKITYVDIHIALGFSDTRKFDVGVPTLSTVGPGSETSYYVSVSTEGPGSSDQAFKVRFSAF